MTRVLVCGGRNYTDAGRVFGFLDALNERRGIDMVIHGGARGADTLAGEWATIAYVYPADWKKHGKRAGHIRNQRMIDEGKPDLVVAFPGGRGTADMVRRARKAGIEVIEVQP